MLYSTDTPEQGLRSLAIKYGACAALFFVNSTFLVYIFARIWLAVTAAIPGASGAADISTDAGYISMMLLNEIASYLIPFIVLSLLFRNEQVRKSGIPAFNDDGYRYIFGETVLLFVSGLFLASNASILTSMISDLFSSLFSSPEVKEAFSSVMPSNLPRYLAFEICTVIIAPICEELIFRRIILRPLRRYGDGAAAFMTALLFSASHFDFSQLLYTFALGYFLAVITIRRDSVIPAVIFHIINNFMAGLTVYMPDTFGSDTADSIFGYLSSSVVTIQGFLYYAGIPATILVLILRLLRLKSSSGIPVSRQFRILLTDPLLIASLMLAVFSMIHKLYS